VNKVSFLGWPHDYRWKLAWQRTQLAGSAARPKQPHEFAIMPFFDCPKASAPASAEASALETVPLKLEELTDRCLGSIALVERLLASFAQRFPIEMSGIVQAFEAGDMARLALAAHELKGAAANMSAPALRTMLERVERAARSGQQSLIVGYLDDLQGEWQRFCQFRTSGGAAAGHSQPATMNRATAATSSENEPCGS
jgi:HPt (histidine-containing phosphotransfer) domain-containing protein